MANVWRSSEINSTRNQDGTEQTIQLAREWQGLSSFLREYKEKLGQYPKPPKDKKRTVLISSDPSGFVLLRCSRENS